MGFGVEREYNGSAFDIGDFMFGGIVENIDRRMRIIDCAGSSIDRCINPELNRM